MWEEQNNFFLRKLISQYRTGFIYAEVCSKNMLMVYLMNKIYNNDVPLKSGITIVRNDTDKIGKMKDFEATASLLIPHYLVAKKRSSETNHSIYKISDKLRENRKQLNSNKEYQSSKG